MNLLNNPFFVLGITPQDSKERIIAVGEDLSLQVGSDDFRRISLDLVNPRKRLSCELAWLLGITPHMENEIIKDLKNVKEELPDLMHLPHLARANFISSSMLEIIFSEPQNVADWALDLVFSFEDIDIGLILKQINQDRRSSEFPEISDLSIIQEGIQERRVFYKKAILKSLDSFPRNKKIKTLTTIVEEATENGERLCPVLISEIVDSYEIENMTILEQEAKRIFLRIEKIKQPSGYEEFKKWIKVNSRGGTRSRWVSQEAQEEPSEDLYLFSNISEILKTIGVKWNPIARPIQIVRKSQGREHELSLKIAIAVRELIVFAINQKGMFIFLATEIIVKLRNLFENDIIVNEKLDSDIIEIELLLANSRMEAVHKSQGQKGPILKMGLDSDFIKEIYKKRAKVKKILDYQEYKKRKKEKAEELLVIHKKFEETKKKQDEWLKKFDSFASKESKKIKEERSRSDARFALLEKIKVFVGIGAWLVFIMVGVLMFWLFLND